MSRDKNVDRILKDALDPLLPGRAVPVVYTGTETEYIVWNYDTLGAVYAEGKPNAARYLIMVHYYLPNHQNPNQMKIRIAAALAAAGCTWPDITNANEESGQHYVLECEYTNGGLAYGLA